MLGPELFRCRRLSLGSGRLASPASRRRRRRRTAPRHRKQSKRKGLQEARTWTLLGTGKVQSHPNTNSIPSAQPDTRIADGAAADASALGLRDHRTGTGIR